MVSITNPVNAQNIVNRFADYVVATGNSGISWGTNAVPFGEMPWIWGGDTNGKGIGINGDWIRTSPIIASTIYNVLYNETYAYTRMRRLRALLFVAGGGGNTGSRPTPGYIYDGTAKANLNGNYFVGIGGVGAPGIGAGTVINAGNLENLFNNLRASYNAAAAQTVTYQVDVCHASCHSSCHSSRGRR